MGAASGGIILKLIENFLGVLRVVEDRASETDGVIGSLILGLERTIRHSSESVAGARLNEPFELILSEEEVLGLDPAHRRGELVGEELNEDGVSELLALFGMTPLLVPVLEDLVEARRARLVVDDLRVLLSNLEGLRNQVGNVLSDQEIAVQVCRVDLLGQVYSNKVSRYSISYL